jgi:hypothetical protein
MRISCFVAGAILIASAAFSQTTKDPFPAPIPAKDGAILAKFADFAAIPYAADEAPRMMLLVDEPGTHRLFVNTMRGAIYSMSYDGKTVTPYLDIDDPTWGVNVQFSSHDRGFQSFAFHPQFDQRGTPGYGKFYTYTDTANITKKADFLPNGPGHIHDTVLLEWTAKNPEGATTYDGGPPREIFRTAKPFQIHNGGQLAFNPLAKPGSADYGLLYVGVADGGNGGDPYKHAQNLSVAFGKILRIDPLGSNSANGQYGIPSTNPFVKNPKPGALGEIYAYGCRNPQRFSWDAKNGNMFLADIGQEVVEKITLVTPGANLGWSIWEGSFTYGKGQVGTGTPHDPAVTYPIVEFDHTDPLFQRSVAVTGVFAYRDAAIPQLRNKLLFGDNPSGEIFYVDADHLPKGGQDSIRRVLFDDNGTTKTLFQLIQEKNRSQGRAPAKRADMRFNVAADGRIFVMNKMDGVIRMLVR